MMVINNLMWVDFRVTHFMVTLCLWFWILAIMGWDPKKILIGHELNQVVK